MDLTVGLPLMFKVVTTGKGHIAHLHVERVINVISDTRGI